MSVITREHEGRKKNNSGNIPELGKLALFRKVEKRMCVK